MSAALKLPPDALEPATQAPRGPHRWQKGAPSANPKGRPPTGMAWAEWTREIASEAHPMARGAIGQEVIRACCEIAMGLPIPRDKEYLRRRAEAHARGEPPPPYEGEMVVPTLADQLRAGEVLRSWGFRLPPQEIELTSGGAKSEYAAVPASDLAKLEAELLAAIAARRALEAGPQQ